MIRVAVHTQTAAHSVAQTAALTVSERLGALSKRHERERGQAAAEYLGIILLVSVIIAVLVKSGIGEQIKNGIESLIQDIGGKGAAPVEGKGGG